MADGFPPRFAVETGFLILLAIGVGLAHLRAWVIVAVMAGGWALVALIEILAWRAVQPPREVPAETELSMPGWNVEEILVPEEERDAEPEPPAEALTTVMPPEAAEAGPEELEVEPAEPEPEPRRRRLRLGRREEVE